MASEPICSGLIANLEREYERSLQFLAQLETSLQSSALDPKPASGASDTLDNADVDDEEDGRTVAPAEVDHQKSLPEKHGLKKKIVNFFKRNSSSFKRTLATPASEDITGRISVVNVDATFEDTATPHEAGKRPGSFGPNALLPTSALQRSARRTSFTLRHQPLHYLQEKSDRRTSGTFAPHCDSTDMSQRVLGRSSLEIVPPPRITSSGYVNSTTASHPLARLLQPPTQTASPSSPLSPATTTLPLLSPSPFSTKALLNDMRPHSLSSVTNPVFVSLEESPVDPRSGPLPRRNSFTSTAPLRPPTLPSPAGSSSLLSPRASHTHVGIHLPPPTISLRARSSNQIGLGALASPLGGPTSESRRQLTVRFPTPRLSEYEDEEGEGEDDGKAYQRERFPRANTFRGTMHMI